MFKSLIDKEQLAADVAARIATGEHFLLALEPNSEKARFYSPLLSPWRGSKGVSSGEESTTKDAYLKGVKSVIAQLRQDGKGKVVISRIIKEDAPAVDTQWIASMLERHFSTHQNSLRYLALTEHGLWIGATPEKLVCINKQSNRFETMALAGTRQISKAGVPWDDKNIYENDLVAKYIVERLESIGVHPQILDAETMVYGNIEHRLRRVVGSYADIYPETIADVLNPTPALGGYPMARALEIINVIEQHDRSLYGGTITLGDENRHDVYVNLRCCRISDGIITYYGGGGIMPDSDPECEWSETERKISEIRRVICGF